jgi:CubicO group peptidase (beta-lactamase class C family)
VTSQAGSTAKRRGLDGAIREAMQRHNVPGVAAGVLIGDDEHHVFAGITSIECPLAVDEDTLFQIGSTGKTFTATAVMRLVEAGRVDLDAPVRTYVPELRLKDERVARTVTVLQLLNHTAGWDGDFFEDQGDGDDALARYVRRMRSLDQVFQPGQARTASYNNAAVALAGRVIEKVTGQTFEAAIKELVLEPVGLDHCHFFPNEIMTRRFAVGHVNRDEKGERRITVGRPWRMFRASNPMGGLSATIEDTLRWARFHMGDGTGRDGRQVLQRQTLQRMQTPTAKLPAALGDSVGISWLIRQVGGVRLVGHGGTTEGQLSAFQMVPERQFAVAIHTNSTNGGQLHREMLTWVLREYLGVEEEEHAAVELAPEQLSAFAGRYESDSSIVTVRVVRGALQLRSRPTRSAVRRFVSAGHEPPPPPPPMTLRLLGDDLYVIADGPATGVRGEFERADGQVTAINLGGRLATRTG